MADSKISALSAITALAAADQLAVAHSGASNSIRADHMPGFELDYVEKTSNTTVTATADGNSTGTAIIDGNAITFDGSTRVKIEFWTYALEINEPNVGHVNLFDGTNDLGRLLLAGVGAGTANIDFSAYGVRFLTPSAASHTFHIRGWKSAGTFTVYGGAGGASTIVPAWYRVTVA